MCYVVVRIHNFARPYWRLTSFVKQCQRVQNEFPMLRIFPYPLYNLICLDALASFLYVFLGYDIRAPLTRHITSFQEKI